MKAGLRAVMVTELIVFLIATAALTWVSRASLRAPRSHGFPRYFAWECLLLLLLLDYRYWFVRPVSPLQLVSWGLLTVSLLMVVPGVLLLRRQGAAQAASREAPLLPMERTTVLVTDGIFRHVRHPMYGSLVFLGWGIFCKHPTWIGAALAVAATLLLVATARLEERENIRYFGDAYREYMRRTRMFIPFVL